MTSDPALRRLALQLTAYATGKARLPLLDGSSSSLSPLGLAFHGLPPRRGSDGSWFRRTGTFEASQDAHNPIPIGQNQLEFFLVVQWRRLLSKGLLRHSQTADVPADLRRVAHHAWWALLPLIRQHDIVMATLLERSQRNYQSQLPRTVHEPFWVGFDNEIAELRFDKQAVVLLNSRRTAEHPRDGFCEAAAKTLMDGFRIATHNQGERHLALCSVGPHVRGKPCKSCPEIAKERPFLSLLTIPLLADPKMRQMLSFSPKRYPVDRAPSERVEFLRWILESARSDDGVHAFHLPSGAPARFIDFTRLRQTWKELDFTTPFDQLGPIEKQAGAQESVKYFERVMHGALSRNSYSAVDQFVAAGWGEAKDFDVSLDGFTAVLDSAVAVQIELADQQAGAAAKARASRALIKQKGVREGRRVVTRMFRPLGRPPMAINIVRAISVGKKNRNFFSVPYEVQDPMLEDKRLRFGRGITDQGTFFWTLQTLNYFANQLDITGAPMYPLGREFVEWATAVDAELVDRKSFNDAIYSDKLGERLDLIARGELAHLGAFSRYEDEQIQRFLVEQPKKKRLGDAEWAELLKVLPGRTKRGVLRRFEELGKRFAFSHGYVEFMRSPWHRKFSAMRRRQWIKEGCAP